MLMSDKPVGPTYLPILTYTVFVQNLIAMRHCLLTARRRKDSRVLNAI